LTKSQPSIGDYHDDALGIDTWFWLSYIGGKAMDSCDGASWNLGMDVAAETIGARSRHIKEVIAGQLCGSDWSGGDECKRKQSRDDVELSTGEGVIASLDRGTRV
jgi:hypothetical protein